MLKPFMYKGTYVCYPMISIIESNRTLHNKKLQEICLFDQAEQSVGLGQINLRKTSSFCEPGNFVNGININMKKDFKKLNGNVFDYNYQSELNSNEIKIKGFLAGSHICCACEYEIGSVGDDMYAGIAIGVPKEKKNAMLFMESVGKTEKTTDKEVIDDIIKSVKEIGMNQGIDYEEIYVAYQHKVIRTDLGCAISITPYFLMETLNENK